MEVNFDKQIDTILRDLAKGKTLAESPPPAHLDADELSAFAENALPPKARLRAMEHLADCSNCRKILSTFVSLNSETESETFHEEVKTIAAISPIPWYRQLFAFPNLSYAMGALALVLVGTIGLLLWQGAQDSQNNVAKVETIEEKVKGPSGVSSDGDMPASETYSTNSANAASNTAAAPAANAVSSTANSAANTASSVAVSNSSAEPPKPLATPVTVGSANTSAPSDAPAVADKAGLDRDKKTAAKEEGGELKKDANQPATEVATGGARNEKSRQVDDNLSVAQNQRVETQNRAAQNQVMMPDGTTRSAPPAPAPAAKKSVSREDAESADEARKNKAETKPTVFKDVAGKSFRNVNGIWTDTAYRGGSTINIKRGTDEYKKLDSGLRSTADYLGGTVIIAWKSKNYKIQ